MSDERIDIWIGEDGDVQFVHDDDVAELFREDAPRTRRASHVEPLGLGWAADMRPVGGPVLLDTSTGNPLGVAFRTRREALAAERAWLDARMREGPVR